MKSLANKGLMYGVGHDGYRFVCGVKHKLKRTNHSFKYEEEQKHNMAQWGLCDRRSMVQHIFPAGAIYFTPCDDCSNNNATNYASHPLIINGLNVESGT